MSYFKVSSVAAAAVTALALAAGGAYGDTGKSPNGAPGPAGNPNQPAAQPQANGPQGPAGNDAQGKSDSDHGKSTTSHGKSGASHGKSGASHGKSGASHGKSGSAPSRSNGSHANPTPGTPKTSHENNGHAGKITICHATKSVKNPYVEITISVNGLHGHGPADDPRHHAGSWKDIIPAPADGCPGTVQQQSGSTDQPATPPQGIVVPLPEAALTAPATLTAPVTEVAPETATAPAAAPADTQGVLGERVAGGSQPAAMSAPGGSGVLGAQASGTSAPKSTLAAQRAGSGDSGSLPFTGYQLVIVLLAAAAALLGGFALRRASAGNGS